MPASTTMSLLAFGDPAGDGWGIVLDGVLVFQARSGSPQRFEGRQETGSPAGTWRFSGEGVELSATPLAPLVPDRADPGPQSPDLCRLEGGIAAESGGGEEQISVLGMRWVHDRPGTDEGSLRVALAWFDEDTGMALAARRPARARGHDRDSVSAVLREQGAPRSVSAAHLSSAADDEGEPLRVGVELWIAAEEEEFEYPHRATGLPAGPPLRLTRELLETWAYPLRWRGRDGEGAGAYLVVRPA